MKPCPTLFTRLKRKSRRTGAGLPRFLIFPVSWLTAGPKKKPLRVRKLSLFASGRPHRGTERTRRNCNRVYRKLNRRQPVPQLQGREALPSAAPKMLGRNITQDLPGPIDASQKN